MLPGHDGISSRQNGEDDVEMGNVNLQEQESPDRAALGADLKVTREQTTPLSNISAKFQATPTSSEKESRGSNDSVLNEVKVSDCPTTEQVTAASGTLQKEAVTTMAGQEEAGKITLHTMEQPQGISVVMEVDGDKVTMDDVMADECQSVPEEKRREVETNKVDDSRGELFINSSELRGPLVDLMMHSMRPDMASPILAGRVPPQTAKPHIPSPSQMPPPSQAAPPCMPPPSQEQSELSPPSRMPLPSQSSAPFSQMPPPSQMPLRSQPEMQLVQKQQASPCASQAMPAASQIEPTPRRCFVNLVAVAESESIHSPQAFRMRKHAPLRRLIRTYADFRGFKDAEGTSFELRCGEQMLDPDKTPADYGMADGDNVTFIGGGSKAEGNPELGPEENSSPRFVCPVGHKGGPRCTHQYARDIGFQDEESLRKHILEFHPTWKGAKKWRLSSEGESSEAIVSEELSPAKDLKLAPSTEQVEPKRVVKAKAATKAKAKVKAKAKAKSKAHAKSKEKQKKVAIQVKDKRTPESKVKRKVPARILNQKDALARAEAEREVPEGFIDARLVFRGEGSPVAGHGVRKTKTVPNGPAKGWKITGFFTHTRSKNKSHKTNLNWRMESPGRSRVFRKFKSERPDVPSLADAVSEGAYEQINRAFRPVITRELRVKRAAAEFKASERKRAKKAATPIADAADAQGASAVPLKDTGGKAPQRKRAPAANAVPIEAAQVADIATHNNSAAAAGIGAPTQQRHATALLAPPSIGASTQQQNTTALQSPQVMGPGTQQRHANAPLPSQRIGAPTQQQHNMTAPMPPQLHQRLDPAFSSSQIPGSHTESGMMLGSQLGTWACGCLAHLRRHPHCGGDGPLRVHLTRDLTVFGRGETCHVALRSVKTPQMISRSHAVIRREGAGYILSDQGSLNGVLVNGERVDGERALRSGDMVTFGVPTAEPEFDYIFEEKQVS